MLVKVELDDEAFSFVLKHEILPYLFVVYGVADYF
jgi:hypothetical protein